MYVMNHYAACRNEQLFERADEFLPERWDRSVNGHTKKPFASLPFGFGTRACLGKPIITQFHAQMYSSVCQTVNVFC